MTPDFTAAVVPVFLEALDLFDRAEKNKAGPVEVERATLRAAFDRAAAKMRGPRLPEWELASYAIAAMVDEILIVDLPWIGQAWWENHALEVELFGMRRRATEFYDRAEKAAALPVRDASTIFFSAVLVGFRGILRDRPEPLEIWLKANSQNLQLGFGRGNVIASAPELPGAPPLWGKGNLVWQSLATTVLAAILIVMAWVWLQVVS
ncbi:MAG: DotU family type IV/VI secretion system protein [Planctomycetota bacterium]